MAATVVTWAVVGRCQARMRVGKRMLSLEPWPPRHHACDEKAEHHLRLKPADLAFEKSWLWSRLHPPDRYFRRLLNRILLRFQRHGQQRGDFLDVHHIVLQLPSRHDLLCSFLGDDAIISSPTEKLHRQQQFGELPLSCERGSVPSKRVRHRVFIISRSSILPPIGLSIPHLIFWFRIDSDIITLPPSKNLKKKTEFIANSLIVPGLELQQVSRYGGGGA